MTATKQPRVKKSAVAKIVPATPKQAGGRDIGNAYRIAKDGAWVDLPKGGRVHIRPRNIKLTQRIAELQTAALVRLGLDPNKGELPMDVRSEIFDRAMIGTTLLGWDGFVFDGVVLESHNADGSIHEENGYMLLQVPSIDAEIGEAINSLGKDEAKVEAAIAKNS